MAITLPLLDLSEPRLTMPLRKDVVPFPGQPRPTSGSREESPYEFGGVSDLPSIRAAQQLARKKATWKDTAPGTSDHPEIQAAEATHNAARATQKTALTEYENAQRDGKYPPEGHPTTQTYLAATRKAKDTKDDLDLMRVKHHLEPSTISEARSSGATVSSPRQDVADATRGFLSRYGKQGTTPTLTGDTTTNSTTTRGAGH